MSGSPWVLESLRRRFLADARGVQRGGRVGDVVGQVSEAYARFGNMGHALSADDKERWWSLL